jgi:RND superfamily putative drug exporter
VAVLVDATIVRAFLFPAILGLLGERAWWSPRWLARVARIRFS